VPFAEIVTLAASLPRVIVGWCGAGGAEPASNELDAADAAPAPAELLATTVQVYMREFDSEVTVSGDAAPVFVRVVPPVLDVQVTLKNEMSSPPVPLAVKVTVTALLPSVRLLIVGASGTVIATKSSDGSDGALSPMPFVATAVQL
jgi:hypothetical protein